MNACLSLLAAMASSALATAAGDTPAWTQASLEATSAAIQVQVEELRGAKFLRPVQVKLTDAKGLRAYVAQREAATMSKERLHRDEVVPKLLGLVAPGLDLRALEMEVLEGQVGGFYDPATDTFFLMDTMRGGVAKVILAHELTHALDDQLYDIDKLLEKIGGETDAELAFRSVVEGSGTNLMNRWTLAHGKELSMEEVQEFQSMGADALKKSPPLMWKPLLASYLAGDGFLSRAGGMNLGLKPAKPEDVERAFRELPRSTEQILHPDRYWDPKEREEPVPVSIDTRQLPEGWTVLGEDTLGELALSLLTTPTVDRKGLDPSNAFSLMSVRFTNKAAEGWGGDRLVLLGRGDDRFLQLVTVWDTPKDAEEFVAALETAAPKVWSGARDAEAGWVARFTPTAWDVQRGATPEGRAFVVVRSASTGDPSPPAVPELTLPWKTVVAEPKSAEDGG
jgi:hypothetical protein